MSGNQRIIETTLSPDEFLAWLRAETIPYEEIVNPRVPLTGYQTFLEQSFGGSKQVVAHSRGNSMPFLTHCDRTRKPFAN